jgi:uncharacterized protein (TIRG00374 family)
VLSGLLKCGYIIDDWRVIVLKAETSSFKLILGIIISLIAVALLVFVADVQQVLESIKQIDTIIIVPVILLIGISLLVRAGAWQIILGKRISLKKSFFIINSGYFVNSFLPFRIGELTRAFLLLPAGLKFWEALPSIVLERLFDIGFTLGFFFIGLPFAAGFSQDANLAFLFTGLLIIGVILLYLLVKKRDIVINWFARSSYLRPELRDRILNLTKKILSGLEFLNNPAQVNKVLLLMIINWTIAVSYQYLLLKAFIPEAKLIWAIFMLGALGLGISVPSSPGNIGVYEASITIALVAFGADQDKALAFAIATHLLSLLITTLFGAYGLAREGSDLRDVWHYRIEHKRKLNNE